MNIYILVILAQLALIMKLKDTKVEDVKTCKVDSIDMRDTGLKRITVEVEDQVISTSKLNKYLDSKLIHNNLVLLINFGNLNKNINYDYFSNMLFNFSF